MWTVAGSIWIGSFLYWIVAHGCAPAIKSSDQKYCSWSETVDFVRHGGSTTMWLSAIGFAIMGVVMVIGKWKNK